MTTKNMTAYKEALTGAIILTYLIVVASLFGLNTLFGWVAPITLLLFVLGVSVGVLALWGLIAAWYDVYKKAGIRYEDN